MYHMEYLFDLDIADKELDALLSSLSMPVPVIKNAVRNTVKSASSRMPTQEEQRVFIEACRETFMGTDLGRYRVTNVKYAGLGNAYFVPDEDEEDETDAASKTAGSPKKMTVPVTPHRI